MWVDVLIAESLLSTPYFGRILGTQQALDNSGVNLQEAELGEDFQGLEQKRNSSYGSVGGSLSLRASSLAGLTIPEARRSSHAIAHTMGIIPLKISIQT